MHYIISGEAVIISREIDDIAHAVIRGDVDIALSSIYRVEELIGFLLLDNRRYEYGSEEENVLILCLNRLKLLKDELIQ